MRLKLVFWIVFTFTMSSALAQQDSVLLDTITISAARFTKYSAGAKVVKLSVGEVSANLNDMMALLPSVTFKNYGNNGLSSIAFRGTSASHTQLNWNGIPVNSPTLGQADFSLFPTYLMDDIAVQYGSTSALTGSGAIGGSVVMDHSTPIFKKAIRANIDLRVASFEHLFTGAKIGYGNKWGYGKTKIYRRSMANNFPYPEKGSNTILTQKNAAVESYGAEQQFHFKLKEKQILSFIGFYNFNHREIQPSVATIGNKETLQNVNTRIIVNYANNSAIGYWEAKLAYVNNDQFYNKNSRVSSEQWSTLLNWDKNIGNKTAVRAGINYHYFLPNTENYVQKSEENRTEFYTSLKRYVLPAWEVSLNLRQALFDGTMAPFTPSLGQEYAIKLNKSQLVIKNRIGRAYRIPTLNDRFWKQGGNPDLHPEESWSVEAGGQWIKKWNAAKLSFEGTYYYQSVNNWIQWTENTPNVWQPENVQQVKINGVELTGSYELNTKEHHLIFSINYSFTQSIITKDVDEVFVNNLLPYVAQHATNIKASWKYKRWNSALKANFSGKRYIEKSNDEFQAIDGFVLLDYQLAREFQVKKRSFQISVGVKNILDVYYEQLKNHAMPGRNFAFNLSINI